MPGNMPYESLFKLIIIGDKESGKTALRDRFTLNTFDDRYDMTVGVNFDAKILDVDGTNLTLQLWDFPSTLHCNDTNKAFFHKAAAVIICVPPTQDISKTQIQNIANLRELNPNIIITIVSTKMDLLHDAEETKYPKLFNRVERLVNFANDNGCVFHQVCAKDGDGVEQLFEDIATRVKLIITQANITQANDTLWQLNQKINTSYDSASGKKLAFRDALLQLTTVLEKNHSDKIIEATNSLIDKIGTVECDIGAKKLFKKYLNDCPTPSGSLLSKLIKTVVITGIFMIVGAALAAGICLSLGLGLAVGAGIVASAGAAGLLSGRIAFFRKNDIEKALDNVVKTGEVMLKNELKNDFFSSSPFITIK